ncbi:MAG TPA: acetylglutamate kinase [Puia sp.]|jgi:acetylglutamate kinase
MEPLAIIKIGGNSIDEEDKLSSFLEAFAAVKGKKILVHGGGKLATRMAETLGIPQQLIDGRRITDAETLKIVTMVYAGYINKNIIAQLQARGCNAIGLTGADGNAILAHKRTAAAKTGKMQPSADNAIDYGFAGDVDAIDAKFLAGLLQQDKTLVFAPITHDGKGQLLNTNADTIARELAVALSADFDTILIYSFEKSGVLLNAEDDSSVIPKINPSSYQQLKDQQLIFAGMIPKLDNAFAALDSGVGKVIIGRAEELQKLLTGRSGTTITHE